MSAAGRMRRAAEAAASAAVAAMSRHDADEQDPTDVPRPGRRFVHHAQAEPASDELRPPEETLRRFQRRPGDSPAVP